MICCLNPNCQKPENLDDATTCQNCGSPLKILRGRYRAVQPLGQGGFGRTYLAVDEDRLKARCVIKQFAPQVQSEKSKEKAINLFKQEAQRLDQLGEHSQIPNLLAYFEQDGYLYLVQQFIEGHSLLQRMRQKGPLNERQIRDVLADVLPVLRFIHNQQVIHRDITPANILHRQMDDRLVLIDFGVAKQVNADSGLEQPGTRIGTEGYSPMEQFRGGKAYPASDLYSLGATCLHLMTQTRPDNLYDPLNGRWFWREYLQQEKGIIVSDQLAYILDYMLKDLVSERYQSADEVMRDLNADSFMPATKIAKTASATATPISTSKAVPTQSQPLRSVPAPAPQVTPNGKLPPANASGSSNSGAGKPSPAAQAQPPQTHPTHTARIGPPPGVEPRSNQSSPNQSSPNQSSPNQSSPNQSSPASLSRPTISKPPTSQSPASGGTVSGRAVPSQPSISGARPGASSPANSHSSPANSHRPISQNTYCLHTLTGHSSWVTCVVINSITGAIASSSLDDTIKIWNLDTGELLLNLTGHNRGVNAIALSPDGKTLVSGSDDYTIKIWNFQSGNLLGTLTGHQRDVNAVVISPDGKFLCSGGEDRTIRLWHMGTGSLLKTLAGVAGMIKAVAISPDGKTMASGGLDNKTKLWSLQTGEQLQTLIGHLNCVNTITFSPDGQLIATASKDKSIKLWNRWTGELMRTLSDHTRDVNAIAISPNGKVLVSASSDTTLKLWEMTTGRLIDTWTEHHDTVNAITFSTDGKILVSASSDKTVKIWQMPV